MSVLMATGLPELPEGFVWWVNHPYEACEESYSITGFTESRRYWTPARDVNKLQVSIVENITDDVARITGKWWWKRTVMKQVERQSVWVVERCQGTHPVAVLNAANRALRTFNNRRAASELVGFYPPMSLTV